VRDWKSDGIEVKVLDDVLEVVKRIVNPQEHATEEFKLLRVSYAGDCELWKSVQGRFIKPGTMQQVAAGDLLYSNIRATDGAIGVVPAHFDGALVSESFTVLRAKTNVDAMYLWSILRSFEIRSDIMSPSTGTGRYTTDWSVTGKVLIPWIKESERKKVAQGLLQAWKLREESVQAEIKATASLGSLKLNSQLSLERFESYKPPQ